MPSKSKKQRNFFRLVKAYKSGKIKNVSDNVKKAANSMTKKQIDDFLKMESEGFPQAGLGNVPGMGDIVAPNSSGDNVGSGDVFNQSLKTSTVIYKNDIEELLKKLQELKNKIKNKK